jgi:uncharacterized membrane protein YhhN
MPSKFFVYPNIPILIAYVVIFLVFTGVELYSAFQEKDKERKIIKPFCVFTLTIIALLTFPSAYCLWIGLLCGVIGDIFFIFKDNQKCVSAGLVAFLVNHILFIAQLFMIIDYNSVITSTHIIIISVVYVVFMIAGFFAIKKFVKPPLPLAIAGTIYMTFLFLDMGINLYGVILGNPYLLFGVFGGLLFIISDCILTFTLFIQDFKRRDFPIMGTYLFAQALLMVGMLTQIAKSGII